MLTKSVSVMMNRSSMTTLLLSNLSTNLMLKIVMQPTLSAKYWRVTLVGAVCLKRLRLTVRSLKAGKQEVNAWSLCWVKPIMKTRLTVPQVRSIQRLKWSNQCGRWPRSWDLKGAWCWNHPWVRVTFWAWHRNYPSKQLQLSMMVLHHASRNICTHKPKCSTVVTKRWRSMTILSTWP